MVFEYGAWPGSAIHPVLAVEPEEWGHEHESGHQPAEEHNDQLGLEPGEQTLRQARHVDHESSILEAMGEKKSAETIIFTALFSGEMP